MDNFVQSGESRKWFFFACLAVLGLALTSNFEAASERAFYTEDELTPVDFPVFYLGGKAVLQRGATPLYNPPADRSQGYTLLFKYADPESAWAKLGRANGFPQVLQFTNPPLSAVVIAPLALLPWRFAYIAWQVLIVILAAATVFLILSLFSPGPDLGTFVMVFAAVCFFFPIRNTIIFGQANVSVLFLWTLGVYLFKRQKTTGSALCFALGTALKISPVVAVALFALRRQWRWLAAYTAGLAGFSMISVAALGWKTNWTWITGIYPCISSGLGNYCNRSFAGLLNVICGPKYFADLVGATEWPIPHGLSLVEKACGAAIGLGFLFWCWRKNKTASGLLDELMLLPLVYLLAAPFSWPHHFALAVLPLIYFWMKAREASSAELITLYVVTMVLGSELPMYIAAYSPVGGPYLIMAAIALWPAATCALIWVGTRLYLRSRAVAVEPAAAA